MLTQNQEHKMCTDALAVQDATNLVAVVGAFHRHLKDMSAAGMDSLAVCTHPASILFSDKIADLTGSRGLSSFSDAHDAANVICLKGRDDS